MQSHIDDNMTFYGMETLKVYLNGNEEIRRFKWNFNEGYIALERKIVSVFSLQEGTPIKIRWKDDENEYINVSSDAELDLMLSSSTGSASCNKLFVLHCQHSRDGDYIHQSVECNVCHVRNLRGNRFKCLECRNFDLCEGCFTRGEHKHHDMVVLRSSGGMGFNIASRISRRYLNNVASIASSVGTLSTSRPGGSMKRAAMDDGDQYSLFSSLSTTADSSISVKYGQPSTGLSNDILRELDELSHTSGTACQVQDYESMGRFITKVLNEKGLNCSYSVENSPHSTNVSSEGMQRGNERDSAYQPAIDREMKGLAHQMETCSINSDSFTIVDASEVANMSSPNGGPQQLTSSNSLNCIPFLHSQSRKSKPSGRILSPNNSPTGELNMSVSSAASTLVPTPTVRSPLPPNIENSRAQMIAMGFTDENGWLTDLLSLHDGDISKCLDDIQRRTTGP